MSYALVSNIRGRVSSEEGTWLSGAKISCGEVTSNALADGSYLLTNLSHGKCELEASLKGYTSIIKEVDVPENDTLEINLVLSKAVGNARIIGTVTDKDTSQPLRNGRVILILPIANRYSDIDVDGHYELSGLTAETYKLYLSVPGYEEQEAEETVAAGQTVFHNFSSRQVKMEEPPWG